MDFSLLRNVWMWGNMWELQGTVHHWGMIHWKHDFIVKFQVTDFSLRLKTKYNQETSTNLLWNMSSS